MLEVARPVQVLGRCATGSTLDQQSDRLGLAPPVQARGQAFAPLARSRHDALGRRGCADSLRQTPLRPVVLATPSGVARHALDRRRSNQRNSFSTGRRPLRAWRPREAFGVEEQRPTAARGRLLASRGRGARGSDRLPLSRKLLWQDGIRLLRRLRVLADAAGPDRLVRAQLRPPFRRTAAVGWLHQLGRLSVVSREN